MRAEQPIDMRCPGCSRPVTVPGAAQQQQRPTVEAPFLPVFVCDELTCGRLGCAVFVAERSP